ncbi:TIGR02444 family protein [Rhodobacter sp. NTK016B]|uniref:TIGR02444 family protein n=1 Tax=Rhodobacter sp. NTK016B TaxID=2759676 RepID=UPI001A8F2FE4|nr:TIGR02444 family protein [Rhodobacter sp. NTK016B]
MDRPLWDFTLELYGTPGIPDACLTIQDRHQADVTLLIFAAWVGAVRRTRLTPEQAQSAAAAVADWHAEIVRPLRAVRRRMKTGPRPAPDAGTEALRDKLKAVEIGAEKIELLLLESLAPPPDDLSGAPVIRDNLVHVLAPKTGPDMPDETAAALEVLVQAAAGL